MRRKTPYVPQDHEFRTIADIQNTHSLFLECQRCNRFLKLNIGEIAYRYGASYPLYHLRVRSKCGKCESTDVQIVLLKNGTHGDLAWTPRRPFAGSRH